MVLEKSPESPLTARRSNPSILKEINPEYSLEGLMLKLQYFGYLMQGADSLEKDPDAGKDWGPMKKQEKEDEMIGWHHQLNGHEFQQTPRDAEGQGSLACCSPWGRKELDMAERLNHNKLTHMRKTGYVSWVICSRLSWWKEATGSKHRHSDSTGVGKLFL